MGSVVLIGFDEGTVEQMVARHPGLTVYTDLAAVEDGVRVGKIAVNYAVPDIDKVLNSVAWSHWDNPAIVFIGIGRNAMIFPFKVQQWREAYRGETRYVWTKEEFPWQDFP